MQRAVRDALLCFMAAMGEAQAEATKEAQKAGIAYARERLDRGGAYLGRKPSYSRHHSALLFVKRNAAKVSTNNRPTKRGRVTDACGFTRTATRCTVWWGSRPSMLLGDQDHL